MWRRLALALLLAPLVACAALWLVLRPPAGPPIPDRSFTLEGVTVLVPGEGRLPRRTIRVEDGVIASLEEAGRPVAGERERFVLPGLIDLHVHHPPAFAIGERELFALLFLAHGVTSVRDTGVLTGSIQPLRARILRGDLAGPRIHACGPVLDGDPPSWPGAVVVRDAEEARAAVRAQAADGVACVKLYNELTPEVVGAIQDEARALGVRVVAHVPYMVSLDAFHDAEIQHLMGFQDWLSVGEPQLREYVATSRRNRLSHTPTLVTFARATALAAGEPPGPAALLLPAHYREFLWLPERNPLVYALLPEGAEGAAARLDVMKRLVARLHRAHVPILAGTDTLNPFVVPGASLHEEIRLLADAGLGPEDALAAATTRAGEALGTPGLGRIEPGAPADLIVLGADPTRDLGALEAIEAVAVDGRLYERDTLDAARERRRAHFESRPVRAIWDAVARAVGFFLARL